MLDQLKNLVKENAQEAIFNNSNVPDDKNEAAVDATSNSIMEVLKDKVSSGNIKDILSSGQESAASNLGGDIMQNLTGKLQGLGIGGDTASSVASAVIPLVLSKILNTGKGGSSLNIQDLVANVAGDNFDLSSLSGLLGGKTGAADQGSGVGGILGKAKDLFK